jgi:hypothetical protein
MEGCRSKRADWWLSPSGSHCDRVTSGIVEMRVILVGLLSYAFNTLPTAKHCLQFKALEGRRGLRKTAATVTQWQRDVFRTLDKLRTARCTSDNSESAKYLSVLAFYIDHGLLVLREISCQLIHHRLPIQLLYRSKPSR